MKVLLRIRDLRTGIVDDQELATIDAARAWLVARPRFDHVLGVPTEGIPNEVNQELKKLCRPLDEEELAALEKLDAAEAAAKAKKRAEREAEKAREQAQLAAELATADPKRPLRVKWTYDGGFENGEDDREITDAAKEAVLAWVRERDEWVEGRGQIVGTANVLAYPAEVPAGEDRVLRGGTFIPVTKPADS